VRRLAVLLAALVLPAAALAADTDPQKRPTAADKRKAASIVLKRADFVAGWKRAPVSSDSDGEFSCPGYDPDQSDLVLTGEAEAEFNGPQGIPSVYSVANVYRTRREATAAWTRSDKPGLVPCIAKTMKAEFAKSGGKVSITKQGRVAFPRYAPRTLALRFAFGVAVTEAGKTSTVPLTIHIVVLGHGRGDAMLMTVAYGSGVPPADLRAFAKLTAQRLAAAKL
jgi:hypothetical protein